MNAFFLIKFQYFKERSLLLSQERDRYIQISGNGLGKVLTLFCQYFWLCVGLWGGGDVNSLGSWRLPLICGFKSTALTLKPVAVVGGLSLVETHPYPSQEGNLPAVMAFAHVFRMRSA